MHQFATSLAVNIRQKQDSAKHRRSPNARALRRLSNRVVHANKVQSPWRRRANKSRLIARASKSGRKDGVTKRDRRLSLKWLRRIRRTA